MISRLWRGWPVRRSETIYKRPPSLDSSLLIISSKTQNHHSLSHNLHQSPNTLSRHHQNAIPRPLPRLPLRPDSRISSPRHLVPHLTHRIRPLRIPSEQPLLHLHARRSRRPRRSLRSIRQPDFPEGRLLPPLSLVRSQCARAPGRRWRAGGKDVYQP